MIVLGFDPGITGAGAIIGLPSGPVVFDLPAIELPRPEGHEGSARRRLHAARLYEILIEHLSGRSDVFAITEALSTGGRNSSVMTIGSQYRTRGALEATMDLVGVPLEEVYPASWKRLYGLHGKAESVAAVSLEARQLVCKLYPDLAGHVQRSKDHNRAEAVLIAHWYRRQRLQKTETAQRAKACPL